MLAASLCLANLVTTVLVKLLSTVAVGHAIAANTEAVPFQLMLETKVHPKVRNHGEGP